MHTKHLKIKHVLRTKLKNPTVRKYCIHFLVFFPTQHSQQTDIHRTRLDKWSDRRTDLYLHNTQQSQQTDIHSTPLDERSARRTDLYLHNTQHSQQTDIHAPGGIRTRKPSNRTAADPHLRPLGHWNSTLDINLRMLTLPQIVALGVRICCELR